MVIWNQPHSDSRQPDLIQLAAVLSDKDQIYAELSTLVNPSWAWIMEQGAQDAHGIQRSDIEANGVPTHTAISDFLNLAKQADVLICHNTSFDRKIMNIAFHRCQLNNQEIDIDGSTFNYYCTMLNSTNLCKLPAARGRGYKWPKLIELHNHLFNEGFDGAHDALNDVLATRRCYYEMTK
jgi:DNA polymerase III epsilon subunit-like protein